MPDKGTYVVVAPKPGGTSHRAAVRRGSTNAFSSAVNASILGTLPFCSWPPLEPCVPASGQTDDDKRSISGANSRNWTLFFLPASLGQQLVDDLDPIWGKIEGKTNTHGNRR